MIENKLTKGIKLDDEFISKEQIKYMSFNNFTMVISMIEDIDDCYKVASWFDEINVYKGENYIDGLSMSLNTGRDY